MSEIGFDENDGDRSATVGDTDERSQHVGRVPVTTRESVTNASGGPNALIERISQYD